MMTMPLSTLPTQETPDGLHYELERVLSQTRGTPVHITSLSQRVSAYRTSYALTEIDVILDDGTSIELLLKDVGPRALTEQARQVKPALLSNPWREIETYRGILMDSGLGTPYCFGASIDACANRYWLFLERVPGVELYQVGEPAIWEQAARWLARFHARFAGHGALTHAPLLAYDAGYYWQWPRRARAFAETWPCDARRQMTWLTERYEPVVERLVSLPRSVIHGEFYASNVLVQRVAGELRICPVDWEMTAIGPGLIDLAALIAGAWADEDRLRFARAYHDALAASRGDRRGFDELLVDLMFCRLHLAMQWLGWAEDWTPPPEHAHDWLSEATSLAKELRL